MIFLNSSLENGVYNEFKYRIYTYTLNGTVLYCVLTESIKPAVFGTNKCTSAKQAIHNVNNGVL